MNDNFQFRPTRFSILPNVVKNLLIINGVFFLATIAMEMVWGIDLTDMLGLHYIGASDFRPFQLVTYMFMHGSFVHILFNMYTLFFFGSVLENVWGGKKFLLYYLVTGIGAAILHSLVLHLQATGLENAITAGSYQAYEQLRILYNTPTVGASGAIYGLLLAYGMLFPNNIIGLVFPPVALKAKYFVIIFGAIELLLGLTGRDSGVAHFAHLGGMIFGFFLIMHWKKNNRMYY